MTELQKLRNSRRKQTAEDFTPIPLVDEMIDKLPPEVWTDPSKTFLDNSAGNGNFLVRVLARKLSPNHTRCFRSPSNLNEYIYTIK